MATSKITNSLRNSIAKEKQSVMKKLTINSNQPKARAIIAKPLVATAKPEESATKTNGTSEQKTVKSKLHGIAEANHNLYSKYLENLQVNGNNFYEYLDKLLSVGSIDELVKLNFSYISLAPVRYQQMIAMNKNMFSDFFKFTLIK